MADKIVTLALERFKLAEDAEHDIREKSLKDLRFRAGEQWPDEIVTGRIQQKRPCLSINRLPQFIRQVTNDQRMNRPSLKIDPTDDATIETAKIMEGMVRHIQVNSNADIAFDTACDSQVTIGFGYFRVITEYCDDYSFEQDIKIKRIKNPFTVYFDPHCTEPDYSDAKWCFIVEDVPRADFFAGYEGDQEQYSSEVFKSIGDNGPDWGDDKTIRVAEYFEVVEKDKTIYLLPDGSIVEEVPEGVTAINKRVTKDRKVVWRKMTAVEVLETKDWAGKYIPVIPVLGDDLDIDGKRELIGMVRYAQDPQRMYNYWASAQTEAIALAPKSPFIVAEGQIEGYETFWKNANQEAYSHLPYKPTSINGILVPPPQRQQAEPPVQAMVQALQQAGEDLKNTTGIYDASLGQRSNETSGKAIMARQREGDVANFHYIDNLSRAIRYLGVILLDLIPKIYDTPRVIRILHEDGEAEMIKINQLFDHNGKQVMYDVTAGRYDVVCNVGPSFTTKRQEAAESMTQMVTAFPPLMQLAGDLMVKNFDWPGAQEVAERLKKMLPPQLQDNEGQQQIPPQVQQQMQQMGQMIEQLTAELNKARDESDAKLIETESRERIAAQDNETKIIIAEMNNNLKALQEDLKHMRDHNKLVAQHEQQERQIYESQRENVQ